MSLGEFINKVDKVRKKLKEEQLYLFISFFIGLAIGLTFHFTLNLYIVIAVYIAFALATVLKGLRAAFADGGGFDADEAVVILFLIFLVIAPFYTVFLVVRNFRDIRRLNEIEANAESIIGSDNERAVWFAKMEKRFDK